VAVGAGPSDAAVAALRQWRSAVARHDGVPAYVVLNDKELVGIATEFPTTLPELAACRGIGPLRLERWGDEILAVLDEVTVPPVDGPATPGGRGDQCRPGSSSAPGVGVNP